MLYQADITIAANTTKVKATFQTLKIARGVITKVMVRPRPGHAALAHLVIIYHEHQIAPSTEGMDFAGDTFPIDWEEYLECDQPPYELKLKGWNDDDTYSHTFTVYVVVLPKQLTLAASITTAIYNLFSILNPRRIFTGGE